jgi:hypothetical protein
MTLPGTALQRDPATYDAEPVIWCSATTLYNLVDLGTPGAANLSCP